MIKFQINCLNMQQQHAEFAFGTREIQAKLRSFKRKSSLIATSLMIKYLSTTIPH